MLTSSSLLLGIMVWAVGTGMAIAMLLDVQVHHLHLQLQQLLTHHYWLSGQHFSITWQDWSEFAWVPDLGIPKWPSSNPSPWPSPTFSTSSPPSSPLLLQLLLLLLLQLLLLGLLSCSSATHTGAAASRKQTRSTRLLTQSLHPPFRSRTLS